LSEDSFKVGKITNDELDLIKQWVEAGLNYEQIAGRLNRRVESIKKTVEDRLLMNLSDDAHSLKVAEIDIKKSAEWKQIEKQLFPDEQQVFLHHWREIMGQFKNDVTHTEKLQIIDVIRIEVSINRTLERIKSTLESISVVKDLIKDENDKMVPDKDAILSLHMKISDLQGAIGQFQKDYKDLLDKKHSGIREIRGTREQRVKRFENAKESITGWVSLLMTSPEVRKKLGIHLEKMKLAQQIEYERLSEYHKYEDGNLEQPILNSKNLKEDNY
jgi:methyl-accepting chemotaxis protein